MNNNIIIGTAGHVDHGKTSLIKALTGIETDRLREEKKRGITIELGFAYIDLPQGLRAGIIDVPGHEKFIKNMLAGAGGIDIALLIVAADEGVMPQTEEHLEILSLLDIRKGVIALTKTDMVDEEWLEMMKEEVAEKMHGTFMEDAKIIPVSSYTGDGIPELQAELAKLAGECEPKNETIPFRIPVDRVFSVDGFGTVITGTLIEGVVKEGDTVTIYPDKIESKVRGIQVHSQPVKQAYPGQRVAVNLAGVHKSELERGDIIAAQDSMDTSMMLDALLKVTADTERHIKNGSRLHFYHGSREILCKVVLLDKDELIKGEQAYAQIRLEENVSLKAGDRFVVRFYSPLETVGGGV
ncbi:MAG: selenocysteine-specific translation elongation factor, partial [Clostridia bacterium]|nr:selenocysteine-specific translation elongation factor [Clostridia bacterium]